MTRKYEEILKDVIRLVAADASKEEIVARARAGKEECMREFAALSRVVNNLDNLATFVAPEVIWQWGWSLPGQAGVGSSQPKTNRTRRVLDIANTLVAQGAERIRTKDVAEQLRSEGDTLSTNDLATAIGNILTRSGRWTRRAPGEYEPSYGPT